MRIQLSRIRFARVAEADLPLLHQWLTRPHVAEWWGPAPSIDELREDYVAQATASTSTQAYIALHDERAIGFIQSYVVMDAGAGWWAGEQDPGARGIDQFLAESSQLGQGMGSAMVRAFVQMLFADPAVTVVQTDPSPANERAIRSNVRAGFSAVARVETPDGPALLMRCARTPNAERLPAG